MGQVYQPYTMYILQPETTTETKYLGLMIFDNLKWESTVTCTQKNISRAVGLLSMRNTMCKRIQ